MLGANAADPYDRILYFIRRPYQVDPRRRNPMRMIEDILLFPFRLVHAIFQYLNFFTMRYTGKPLAHSGPALQRELDQRRMILWGNLVETQREWLGEVKVGQSLVPGRWEVCRKAPDGEIAVLAKSVSWFDLDQKAGCSKAMESKLCIWTPKDIRHGTRRILSSG